MASSVEAIADIREYVLGMGNKMTLGQIIRDGGDEIAGYGYDQASDVHVDGLDPRVFPGGSLSGQLACRAVLLESSVAHRFVDGQDASDTLYLRTRLTYEDTGLTAASAVDIGKALTIGGPVMHLSVFNLRPGDGEQLDDYYARLAAHEALLRGDEHAAETHADERPQRPPLNAHYEQVEPGVPNVKGTDTNLRASERLRLRRKGLEALQLIHPAARVLRVGTQGQIGQNELADWASEFVR